MSTENPSPFARFQETNKLTRDREKLVANFAKNVSRVWTLYQLAYETFGQLMLQFRDTNHTSVNWRIVLLGLRSTYREIGAVPLSQPFRAFVCTESNDEIQEVVQGAASANENDQKDWLALIKREYNALLQPMKKIALAKAIALSPLTETREQADSLYLDAYNGNLVDFNDPDFVPMLLTSLSPTTRTRSSTTKPKLPNGWNDGDKGRDARLLEAFINSGAVGRESAKPRKDIAAEGGDSLENFRRAFARFKDWGLYIAIEQGPNGSVYLSPKGADLAASQDFVNQKPIV